MKIRCVISVLFCTLAGILSAQQRYVLSLDFEEFSLTPVNLNETAYYQINMGENFTASPIAGHADLPCYNQIIDIPAQSTVSFTQTVLDKDTIYIKDNILIAPKQKSRIKSFNDTSFYFDKQYYTNDVYMGESAVCIQHLGQMKDCGKAVLSVLPLRYNPVENAIERIKKLQIEITFTPSYKTIGANAYNNNVSRPYTMVILADDMFQNTLKPFVQWKTAQGFRITEIYTSQTGKEAWQIKKYLKDLYLQATPNSPAFDYLLIAGDTELIPAFTGNYTIDNYPKHATDLYYAEYTDDILPDVFYGRMSASDTVTLQNILNKTLKYEQYLLSDTAYLQNSLLVAGKETGDNAPTFTNGQMNYAKQYLVALTDTTIYYNPSSADNANKIAIKNNLNAGNAWINYTGHGTFKGWQNPPLRVEEIDTVLKSGGMYGIFVNNCCHTGKYDEKQCFTEKLLQTEDKGGVAVIGASDYTLWDEDYYWSVGCKNVSPWPVYQTDEYGIYDRLFHTHNEPFKDRYITMGQIVQAGNLAVAQSLSDYSNVYWEMYNLQGDPSLMPYIGIPKTIACNLPDTVILTEQTLNIQTCPYTYTALSSNDSLIDAKQADSSGSLVFDIGNIVEPQTVKVVMTNQFCRPLIDSIVFVAPEKPFIALKNIVIKDIQTGECAEFLYEGGEYAVSFDVVNTGSQALTSESNYIELITQNNLLITQNNFFFSAINPSSSLNAADAFHFKVKKGEKNFTTSQLDFSVYTGNTLTYQQQVTKEILAPDLCISSCSMQNMGDTLIITANIFNNGRKQFEQGSVVLGNYSSEITPLNTVNTLDALDIKQSGQVSFMLLKNIDDIDFISFDLTCISGEYTVEKSYNIAMQPQTESFENGFSALAWDNNSSNAWVIDSTVYFSGGRSARSAVKLANNSKSRMFLTVNNDVSSTVSFYVKVSSEEKYDKFVFYIDNESVFTLSGGYTSEGTEKPFVRKTFTLPSGEHLLCFSYEKDQDLSYGYDCAWIDEVVLQSGTDTIVLHAGDLQQDNIIMFPNPAKDNITLNAEGDVFIFNGKGQLVKVFTDLKAFNVLDVTDLPNGFYTLTVKKRNQKMYNKKLIIIK